MSDEPGGKRPAGEGWFVLNAREAQWIHNEAFGAGVTFEGDSHFEQLGVNIQAIWPGQSCGLYHGEAGQEDFLILRGECLLLIEGEERRLKPWDLVHCPPWTEHIMVGAGEGPCVFVGIGARVRDADPGIVYPASELAQRHGAGVAEETPDPKVAYADAPRTTRGPCPEGLL